MQVRQYWEVKKQTPAIDNNIINTSKKKYNVNKIIYFNYNKKDYYINTYTKCQKNQCWSQLPLD